MAMLIFFDIRAYTVVHSAVKQQPTGF